MEVLFGDGEDIKMKKRAICRQALFNKIHSEEGNIFVSHDSNLSTNKITSMKGVSVPFLLKSISVRDKMEENSSNNIKRENFIFIKEYKKIVNECLSGIGRNPCGSFCLTKLDISKRGLKNIESIKYIPVTIR